MMRVHEAVFENVVCMSRFCPGMNQTSTNVTMLAHIVMTCIKHLFFDGGCGTKRNLLLLVTSFEVV